MIFVTVGTGCAGFDDLTRAVDDLAARWNEPFYVQIGNGRFEPKHCSFFRFAPSLALHYASASVVVTAGGVGTLFELLRSGIHVIGISNHEIPDQHQTQILQVLGQARNLLWCKKLPNLGKFLLQARSFSFASYVQPDCWIERPVLDFVADHVLRTTP